MAARESDRGKQDQGRPAERPTPSPSDTDRRGRPETFEKRDRGNLIEVRDTVQPPPKKGDGE